MAAGDEDEPTMTQTQRNRRRDETPEGGEDVDMEDGQQENGSGGIEQLAKGLVRYALSCEYARKPIKRQDVNEKGMCYCGSDAAWRSYTQYWGHTLVSSRTSSQVRMPSSWTCSACRWWNCPRRTE